MEKRKRHNGNQNGAMASLSSAKRFLLSSLKALSAATTTDRKGLEEKSFKSLYELARKKGIKGRSKMTKKQLAKSLAQRRPL